MKARLLLGVGALALAAWLSGCASGPGRRIPVPGVSSADSSAAPGTAGKPAPQARDGVTSKSPKAPASGAPSASPAPAPGAGQTPGADTSKQALVPGTIPAGDIKVTTSDPAPPKGEPLIMENADRMEGFRSRGEYILAGKVRFTHGALRLETERAVWMKDRSLIYAESGMRIVHRGAVLTSERGSYDKNLGQATAEGQVRMRDSSGEVEASGNSVTYLRFKHVATLTGSPEVRRYYRKADSSVSVKSAPATAQAAPGPGKTAAAPAPAPAVPVSKPLGEITDTLVIRGKVLTFNDSSGVATADQDVRITRKEMEITCKKAEYHDRADSLYLTGDPQVKFDESLVKGLMMKVGMNGEEIRSLLVKGNAQAKSVEPATDTSVARQSDVLGDSLFMAFRDKAIDSVQVFRNAKGSYFDVDKPGFVNRMSGDYMVLRFVDKQVNSANVLGKAKSTYFHLEKKVFKGKNDAEGDTIDFAFKDGKVQEVLVRGQAKGTYFGEPSRKKKGGPDSNTAVPADTALGTGGKPAAQVPAVPAPAAAVQPAPRTGDGPAPKDAPAGSQPAPEGGEEKRKEIDPAQQPYNPWRRK